MHFSKTTESKFEYRQKCEWPFHIECLDFSKNNPFERIKSVIKYAHVRSARLLLLSLWLILLSNQKNVCYLLSSWFKRNFINSSIFWHGYNFIAIFTFLARFSRILNSLIKSVVIQIKINDLYDFLLKTYKNACWIIDY